MNKCECACHEFMKTACAECDITHWMLGEYDDDDCSDWEAEGGWTPKDDTPKRKRNR